MVLLIINHDHGKFGLACVPISPLHCYTVRANLDIITALVLKHAQQWSERLLRIWVHVFGVSQDD